MRREYEAEEDEWWEEEKARRVKTRRVAPAQSEGSDPRRKRRPHQHSERRRDVTE